MAWSKAAPAKYGHGAERIESDLTDAAWNWLAPLPPPKLERHRRPVAAALDHPGAVKTILSAAPVANSSHS